MQIKAIFEVNHEGCAIHSIDFHPNGNKIVTGGCGSGDSSGAVYFWDISSLYTNNHNVSKLGSATFPMIVNCARYSPSGRDIAVVDDAKTISILRLHRKMKNNDGKIEETYRVVKSVVGHSESILQVEFSPTGSMLATVSVDCTAKIWNFDKFPQCLAILDEKKNGHKDRIKGCSWDPVGRYFATQSADKSVKIWTTDSFECVFTLTEPFQEKEVMFTRMDWASDGSVLVLPSATKSSLHTAQILSRKDWSHKKEFVGHDNAIGTVSFCKYMRVFKDKKTGELLFGHVVALGGSDRSLSVWSIPASRRPLVVIHNIVDQPIVDIRWYSKCLVLCSLDGTTRFILFKESEIGVPLSDAQFNEHCLKLYGCLLPGRTADNTKDEGTDSLEKLFEELDKIPEPDTYQRKDEVAPPPAKKIRKEKPKIEEKKQPVHVPAPPTTQLVFKSKKKPLQISTYQLETETVEDDAAEKEVVQIETMETEKTDQSARKIALQRNFAFEQTKINNPLRDELSEPEILCSNERTRRKVRQFFILKEFGLESNPITITNEKIFGGGNNVMRIRNLNPMKSIQIDGHALACEINKFYLIILTNNKDLIVVDRTTFKHKNLYHFEDNPVDLQISGDYCFVFTDDNFFHFLNISCPTKPQGSICKCTTKQFGDFSDFQMIAVNGFPVLHNKKEYFVAIPEKNKWIELKLDYPSTLPQFDENDAMDRKRIIENLVIGFRKDVTKSSSESNSPDQTIPSERKIFQFLNLAFQNEKSPSSGKSPDDFDAIFDCNFLENLQNL
uniref:Protein HIRA n=1 Tax=Panagrolaimus sp. JU765 TaxID=591449 RepID=A0AC34QPS8_9BILA